MSRRRKPTGFEAMPSGSVGSILSNLYRKILHDLGITPDRYAALMDRYIRRAYMDPNRKEMATARQTLSKELLKPTMTFKTFFKGLVFLAPKKIEIRIRLWHHNGTVSEHVQTVSPDEDFDEKDGDD